MPWLYTLSVGGSLSRSGSRLRSGLRSGLYLGYKFNHATAPYLLSSDATAARAAVDPEPVCRRTVLRAGIRCAAVRPVDETVLSCHRSGHEPPARLAARWPVRGKCRLGGSLSVRPAVVAEGA